MKEKQLKGCVLILSFCLAVSLGGNLYSLAYPLIQKRAEPATIAWIPSEYSRNAEVIYPEVISMNSADVPGEEFLDSTEGDAVVSDDMNPPKESTTPSATEQPVATQKPSIRYNGATVYVTKSGTKFHIADCSSLSKSKIAMSFEEACAKMYEPCGKCIGK